MSPDSALILKVTTLVKRFGGFHALDGLSFHVTSGEILGLVGPNGSGKTTAINVISGLYAPDGGSVTLQGKSIGGMASHRLVHLGINRTFQVPKPFLSLTVRENIEVALAYGRSGDKGNNANIGIFARRPEYEPILDAEVTEEAVAKYFAHRIQGKVTRWRLPGINGFNFLLRQALGGGGMASLKADPLAKAFAQMLLDMPVRVPAEMVRKLAA